MAKFRLVHKKTGAILPDTEKGLSNDECCTLQEYLGFIHRVEEIVKVSAAAKDSTEDLETKYLADRTKFMDSLSATEYSDLREKRKTISHNTERGFYLRSIKEGMKNEKEGNFSFWQIEEKRKMELKAALKILVWECSRGQFQDYERLEVEDCISGLFK